MKQNRLLIIAAILFFVAGCTNKKTEQARINKRDLTITKANAYNSIFLDSMAVEKFIIQQKINDSLANSIRDFYDARNYEFAWFSGDGLSEQAMAFRTLYKYADDKTANNRNLEGRLDDLSGNDSMIITAKNAGAIKTELQLTSRFIRSAGAIYKDGNLKVEDLVVFIPAKKMQMMQRAEMVLNNKSDEAPNEPYTALKKQLDKYYQIAKAGGWKSIPATGKKLKKGSSDPVVALIKKRLQVSGEYAPGDTGILFNDDLETAVKNFQAVHGYKPDGTIGKQLIADMNVPAAKRVEQLMINMERMRWTPADINGETIFVNIPEYMLHVRDGKSKLFDMPVVVGKEGNNTTMFYGDLNQVVFSPYWNVPGSITEKEILPQMQKNKDYLAQKHMEIKEVNGKQVVRQLPSEDNPLGKVKFLFPNSYDIYFHDTPAKDLFEKDKRAYSHGCIRLADPVKLANFILKDSNDWSPERIDSAMNSGQEKYVKIKKAIPVLITYHTAWVDENGQLNFRDDTYGHDAKMAGKMFVN